MNKKRGNGEGSITFHKASNRYMAQYTTIDGQRKTTYQKKNESLTEFKKRFTKIINDINQGTYIEKRNDTVKNIIEKHIKQKFNDGITKGNSYNRDKNTLKSIEKCCYKFINRPIQKVTLNDIQSSKENMKIYSQSDINKMWRLLKKAFSIASSPSIQLIPFNIMQDENLIKPMSDKKTKKVYPLTTDEREKLKSVLDNEEKNHKFRNIVKMEWLTSMRIGEVLARSKNDINKNEKTLHIHNTLTKDESGKLIVGEHTKTYNKETGIDEGERNFPIDEELEDIINNQLSLKIVNMYGLLFWDYENNTFINPRRVNDWLESINKKYKISKKQLHNHRLRHDRITQWKEAGIDISAIQYLAGHVENSNVTDVYIDVSQEFAFEQLKKAN